MRKNFFYMAVALCVAISNVSCGGDDDTDGLPPSSGQVELPVPPTAGQAAAYVIPADAVTSAGNSAASLVGIHFTESGKAIFEVSSAGKLEFVTYNAKLEGARYVVTDDAGQQVGTVTDAATKGTSGTTIDIEITIYVPGIGTVVFHPASPVAVQKVVAAFASTSATANICRTWTVTQMNITLDGDVDLVMLENSGNLERFADEAQRQGAGLTDKEMAELRKTFKGITLDQNGLFSIEYYENGSNSITSEACTWYWTDEASQALKLQLRERSLFGNKFLSDNTTIKADFNPTGASFTLNTVIEGSKRYKATLTIVLK